MQHFRALMVSGAVLGVAVAACTSKDSLLDGAGSSGNGGSGGSSAGAGENSGGGSGSTGGSAGMASTGGALGNGGSKGGGAGSVSTGGTSGGTTGGSGGATDAGKGGTGGGSGEAGSGGTAGSGAAAGSAGAEQCPEGQVWCTGCTPGTGSCGVACTGAQCETCADADTLEECEARLDCHSVFRGGEFAGCATGDLAKCTGEPVTCDAAVPNCENPAFVISYRRDISCYEGCVQPKDCEPTCASPEDPLECLCYSNADCPAGENCYSADCANQIPGVCTTRPPNGCFGDIDCPTGQTCMGAMPTGCSSTAPSIVGTCGVEECAGGDCSGYSGPGCTCSNGEECIEATGATGSGWCRNDDGTCSACKCAAPYTPIATPSGERAIAELRPGDLVYSVDGEAIRAVPIARINRTPVVNHSVLRVTFDNGRSIDMTAGHPLADGRPLSALRPGSELMGGIVVGVTSIPYEHDATYDILPLSTSGAYFASDVLVGSTLAGGSIDRRATPRQLSTK